MSTKLVNLIDSTVTTCENTQLFRQLLGDAHPECTPTSLAEYIQLVQQSFCYPLPFTVEEVRPDFVFVGQGYHLLMLRNRVVYLIVWSGSDKCTVMKSFRKRSGIQKLLKLAQQLVQA